MAARRNRPVLYEIVRANKRQREQSWRSRLTNRPKESEGEANAMPAKKAPPPTPPPAPAAPPSTPPAPSARMPAPTGSSAATGRPAPEERILDLRDGLLTLRLNWVAATVVGIVLFALLMISYQAGMRAAMARSEAVAAATGGGGDEAADEQVADEPLAPEMGSRSPSPAQPTQRQNPGQVAVPSGAGAAAAANQRATQTDRRGGLFDHTFQDGHYVLVQHIPKRTRQAREIAESAALFLQQQGIAATIEETREQYNVIATQRFGSTRAAGGLLQRIRQLGKQEFGPRGLIYDLGSAYVVTKNSD